MVAQRILKPGGSLITYCGTYALEEILQYMKDADLHFHWILALSLRALMQSSGKANVTIKWKPMLWFVKGNKPSIVEFVADLIDSSTPKKIFPDMEQPTVEANILSRD